MSEMGLHLKTSAPTTTQVDLTDEETYLYMKRFQALDTDGKGFITINDLRKHFKVLDLFIAHTALNATATRVTWACVIIQ